MNFATTLNLYQQNLLASARERRKPLLLLASIILILLFLLLASSFIKNSRPGSLWFPLGKLIQTTEAATLSETDLLKTRIRRVNSYINQLSKYSDTECGSFILTKDELDINLTEIIRTVGSHTSDVYLSQYTNELNWSDLINTNFSCPVNNSNYLNYFVLSLELHPTQLLDFTEQWETQLELDNDQVIQDYKNADFSAQKRLNYINQLILTLTTNFREEAESSELDVYDHQLLIWELQDALADAERPLNMKYNYQALARLSCTFNASPACAEATFIANWNSVLYSSLDPEQKLILGKTLWQDSYLKALKLNLVNTTPDSYTN